jgi:hypothetical protein
MLTTLATRPFRRRSAQALRQTLLRVKRDGFPGPPTALAERRDDPEGTDEGQDRGEEKPSGEQADAASPRVSSESLREENGPDDGLREVESGESPPVTSPRPRGSARR